MGAIYVARSAKFSEWASDVGLSKHVYRLGYTDESVEEVIKANWCGFDDWTIVGKKTADGVDEAELVAKLARKEKMIDPVYYPRLKGATGIFKVAQDHVENSIIVAKTMANDALPKSLRVKPSDFAAYVIENVLK
jgi:hypothetical protein